MIKQKTKIISAILLIIFSLSLVSAATSSWQAQNTNLSISDSLFVNTANGNIGIGNSTPVSRLHVSGNSYFAGDVNITGTLYGGSPVKIGGGIQLVSSSGAPFTCDSTKKGAMYFDSSNNKYYTCNGTAGWAEYTGAQGAQGSRGYDCQVDSDYYVRCGGGITNYVRGPKGDTGSTGYNCYMSGYYQQCGDGRNDYIRGPTGDTGDWGTTLWVEGSGQVTTTSNVGVGTSSPGYKLDAESTGASVIFGAGSIGGSGGAYSLILGAMQTQGGGVGSVAKSCFSNFDGGNPGPGAVALGSLFLGATGESSVALGEDVYATGRGSVAIGGAFRTVHANGLYSTGICGGTTTGTGTTAIGGGTTATGDYSTAIGTNINVVGANSVGISLDVNSETISNANKMAIFGGPVGLGTVTPSAAFDVVGSAEIFKSPTTPSCDTAYASADSDLIVFANIEGADSSRGQIVGCTSSSVSMNSFATCDNAAYRKSDNSFETASSPNSYVPASSIAFVVPKGYNWAVWKALYAGSATCTVYYIRLGQ